VLDTGPAPAVRTTTAVLNKAAVSKFKMYYAMQMYFANGGGPCWIVSTGNQSGSTIDKAALKAGLDEIARIDEPTLIIFPDGTGIATADNYYALINDALKQSALLQDRFVIFDVVNKTGGINMLTDSTAQMRNSATLGNSLAELKYGAAYYPNLNTILTYYMGTDGDINVVYKTKATAGDPEVTVTSHAPADLATKGLNLADLLAPRATLDAGIKTALGLTTTLGNSGLYSLIKDALKAELEKSTIVMTPSSAVAGLYARIDSARGVWKAPANESLSYVTSAEINISHDDQANMNIDATSGKSINAIRFFTGKGLLVWGARTLAGNDNEWRYVNVRRFFNFAEESIKKGSEWVVFEPNDANTWIRVKAMIENFLLNQWRNGALAGAKPEHAFYVKVGLGVTMTAQDILEGRMNIEIGMAVVRPAEFIILKFSHKLQES
jgi:uncharacterized protein